VWVVGGVHGHCIWRVVYGDIDGATKALLDAGGGAAGASEVVDHQSAEVDVGLGVDAVEVGHAEPP
jgi:hypothetical protein